ncbi:MAG: hypothetical protein SynsKO_40220 [Synoicihabitans sp.]
MSAPYQPSPRRYRGSRIIIGEKANPKAKPTRPPIPLPETTPEPEVERDEELLTSAVSGGPRSSFLGGALSKVGIRLFRLSTKLIPAAGVLVGGTYGYTYFFGSIPLLDALKEQLGMEVAPQVAQEESRVNQMLQKTRDAVAANDTRVALSNAIVEGDIETADAIQEGKLIATSEGLVSTDGELPEGESAESLMKNAMGGLLSSAGSGDTTGIIGTDISSTTIPSNTAGRVIVSPYEGYEQTVTVVQESPHSRSRFRNIDYQQGPPASPGFRRWMENLKVQGVTRDFRPRIIMFGQSFPAGEIVDFARGITFEGFSDDDTVLVFREQSGAFLAAKL